MTNNIFGNLLRVNSQSKPKLYLYFLNYGKNLKLKESLQKRDLQKFTRAKKQKIKRDFSTGRQFLFL